MLYMISYDLKTPGQDYPALVRYLTGIGAKRVLRSQWLLASTAESAALRDQIRQGGQFDPNDRLLVTEVTKHSAWYNVMLSDPDMQELFRHARA